MLLHVNLRHGVQMFSQIRSIPNLISMTTLSKKVWLCTQVFSYSVLKWSVKAVCMSTKGRPTMLHVQHKSYACRLSYIKICKNVWHECGYAVTYQTDNSQKYENNSHTSHYCYWKPHFLINCKVYLRGVLQRIKNVFVSKLQQSNLLISCCILNK